MAGSYLGRDIGNPDGGFPQSPRQMLNTASFNSKIACFHILSSSSFFVTSTIQRYVVWAMDGVVKHTTEHYRYIKLKPFVRPDKKKSPFPSY